MKAVVIREAGPPEVLTVAELPVPRPAAGWVLIQVKAFGLNRSELFTRQGYSPGVESMALRSALRVVAASRAQQLVTP